MDKQGKLVARRRDGWKSKIYWWPGGEMGGSARYIGGQEERRVIGWLSKVFVWPGSEMGG